MLFMSRSVYARQQRLSLVVHVESPCQEAEAHVIIIICDDDDAVHLGGGTLRVFEALHEDPGTSTFDVAFE